MIACRIKGREGWKRRGKKKQGEKMQKDTVSSKNQKAPSAHSLPALAEGVRHLITVAIKRTFTGVLLYARH